MKRNTQKHLIILGLLAAFVSACYYDNAEDLYQNYPKNCDVSAVSYSIDVRPIIDQNCVSCHGGVAPQAGLDLTTYDKVKANTANIRDRINRPISDALVMPQGGPMPQCSIDKVTAWIDAGALNN
jgi:hypothetical protein